MRSRYFVLYTKELTKLIDNFNSRKKELVEEFKCGIISRLRFGSTALCDLP